MKLLDVFQFRTTNIPTVLVASLVIQQKERFKQKEAIAIRLEAMACSFGCCDSNIPPWPPMPTSDSRGSSTDNSMSRSHLGPPNGSSNMRTTSEGSADPCGREETKNGRKLMT